MNPSTKKKPGSFLGDKKILENTYTGKMLSPGLTQGTTFVYRDTLAQLDEFYEIEDAQIERELQRLDRSIAHSAKLLNDLASRVEKEMDETVSGVFHAHSAILQDDTLKNEVKDEIKKELVSAGSAARTVFRRWERRFKAMESDVSKQKADDMRDLARRLISSLAGNRSHALEDFPPGNILVARRLLPSDAIVLGRKKAAAVILEKGGTGSHAALFAREIGLPCIAEIPGIVDQVESGTPVLVDADAARAIFHPTEKQREDFARKVEQRKRTSEKAWKHAHEPAITKDGKAVSVFANVGSRDDTKAAIENGAEGVGLYRIERAYLDKQEPPDVASLFDEMRSTLEPAAGLPVTVRLLDTGADKPLPY
ncbi:MAG: putative PEP-binding protein, partial [Verrucomicrobiota bacterium]|nr:putative PEP-binding protein [Verrucomicrobiota bacterium]